MKKIFTLALGLLLLISCSSDDSGSSTIDISKLTNKKWYFSTTQALGQTIPYDGHEECGKDYIEFLSNGVYKYTDVYECETTNESGSWTLSDTILNFTVQSETSTVKISELTDAKLVVIIQYDYNEDGVIDTVVDTFTAM